ncbi:MAG: hypothetical protein QXH37_05840 [Candidatus Bathyarchaeia archaeon]
MGSTKTDEMKTLVRVLNELKESYVDSLKTVKEATEEVKMAKQLWRGGDKSILIKVGLALIAFPEPIISDVLGSFLVAVGTVQKGIQRRTLHVNDVPRTFQSLLKELNTFKDSL